MQNVPVFVLVDGRNTRPSGLSLQNLVRAANSLLWSTSISFSSDWVKGLPISRSLAPFQIETHMNFHLVEANLSSIYGGLLCESLIGSRTCVGCVLGPVPGDLLLM